MKKGNSYYKGEVVFALGEVPKINLPEIKLSYVTSAKNSFSQRITSSKDAEKIFRKLFGKGEMELREQVIILYLNNTNKVIGYYRHSMGGIAGSVIDPRLILATALKSLSTGIILCHNHPSGSLKPSKSDIKISIQLKEAVRHMEIDLLDHIIITKKDYYSMADNKDFGLDGITSTIKKLQLNKIICGNAITELKKIPSDSIDCVITSPPYWQLRDYGWKGQWGLEKNYIEYLNHLWELMDQIKRVLKPQGSVWMNLGDTYFGSGNGSGRSRNDYAQPIQKVKIGEIVPVKANNDKSNHLKQKCLAMIPHRFAIGCIESGWIVRNDIIWAKTNGLPESVRDRFAKKHEHIFFLVKNKNYFFDLDAVRDPHKESSKDRTNYSMSAYGGDKNNPKGMFGKGIKSGAKGKRVQLNPLGKNPGDITDFWKIATKPSSEKHYATFNAELITKPILAGCPKGGIVLDPFCGTGTTGIRAIELDRNFIGIDGKKEYCRIAEKNIAEALKNKQGGVKRLIHELQQLKFNQAA